LADGSDKVTRNRSLRSLATSPTTWTVKILLVSPGRKTTSPEGSRPSAKSAAEAGFAPTPSTVTRTVCEVVAGASISTQK